jgi:hypothetical protein
MTVKKRWQVLYELMKGKNPEVGAEIGIKTGQMSIKVLSFLPSIKTYYAIDPWKWYPDFKKMVNPKKQKRWNQKQMDAFFDKFKNDSKAFKDKIKILRMTSKEAAEHIPDGSLDFCFIDGNHAYEYVKEDIQLYLPKVKKGGLFGGHDYNLKLGGIHRGDVKKAVDESFDDFILGENETWWVWV